MRDAFRSFRTDRMIRAEVMEQKYPTRRKVLLKQMQDELERQHGVRDMDVFG